MPSSTRISTARGGGTPGRTIGSTRPLAAGESTAPRIDATVTATSCCAAGTVYEPARMFLPTKNKGIDVSYGHGEPCI